jgi:hypothetical protein
VSFLSPPSKSYGSTTVVLGALPSEAFCVSPQPSRQILRQYYGYITGASFRSLSCLSSALQANPTAVLRLYYGRFLPKLVVSLLSPPSKSYGSTTVVLGALPSEAFRVFPQPSKQILRQYYGCIRGASSRSFSCLSSALQANPTAVLRLYYGRSLQKLFVSLLSSPGKCYGSCGDITGASFRSFSCLSSALQANPTAVLRKNNGRLHPKLFVSFLSSPGKS